MTERTIKDKRGKEITVMSLPDQGFTSIHIRDRFGNTAIAYLDLPSLRDLVATIQEAIAAHKERGTP